MVGQWQGREGGIGEGSKEERKGNGKRVLGMGGDRRGGEGRGR